MSSRPVASTQLFGVSFSLKCKDELQGTGKECLKAALQDMGVRRLRLMSYWDDYESVQGTYNFSELDWQIDLAETYGAEVTLCLGLRQPRWPESHWPEWAKNLSENDLQAALLTYIEAVVQRYKHRTCIVSWQLENEARLKGFGVNGNFNRKRLKAEFALVKSLDTRPIIMSTSDTFGIPIFAPVPDIYGFSLYRFVYRNGKYKKQFSPVWVHQLRAFIIRIVHRRPCYIHELQCEPWGPGSNASMPIEEQFKSVNCERFISNIEHAKKTNLYPIDLWGLEWWWWLKTQKNDDRFWKYAKQEVFGKSNLK